MAETLVTPVLDQVDDTSILKTEGPHSLSMIFVLVAVLADKPPATQSDLVLYPAVARGQQGAFEQRRTDPAALT